MSPQGIHCLLTIRCGGKSQRWWDGMTSGAGNPH